MGIGLSSSDMRLQPNLSGDLVAHQVEMRVMRSTFISILLAAGTVSAAVAGSLVTASCSSSTSGGASSGGTGDDAGDGGGVTPFVCTPYQTSVDLTTPVVSFSKDVMPIFEHSCGLSSSCHYDPKAIPTLGIFLGCDINTSSTCNVSNPAPQVYQDLVGSADGGPDAGPLAALEDPMPYVTPGDPTKSYIIHKLDGDTCTFTDCIANNKAINTAMNPPDSGPMSLSPNWCGQSMPYNNYMLPSSTTTKSMPPGFPVGACGGSNTQCGDAGTFSRDTIRLWIAQGALNN
jgi:hypothetical protein